MHILYSYVSQSFRICAISIKYIVLKSPFSTNEWDKTWREVGQGPQTFANAIDIRLRKEIQ